SLLGDGPLVCGARDLAAVYAAVGLLAQYGGVAAADPGPTSAVGPAPQERSGSDGMAGGHGARLERGADAVRVGWQARGAAAARPGAAAPFGRLGGLHKASAPAFPSPFGLLQCLFS